MATLGSSRYHTYLDDNTLASIVDLFVFQDGVMGTNQEDSSKLMSISAGKNVSKSHDVGICIHGYSSV